MKVVLCFVMALLFSSPIVSAGTNKTDYLTKTMTIQIGNNRALEVSIGSQGTYVFDCEYVTGTINTFGVLYKLSSMTVTSLSSDHVDILLPYQGSNGTKLGTKKLASPPDCNYARSVFNTKTKKDVYYDGSTFDVVYR